MYETLYCATAFELKFAGLIFDAMCSQSIVTYCIFYFVFNGTIQACQEAHSTDRSHADFHCYRCRLGPKNKFWSK